MADQWDDAAAQFQKAADKQGPITPHDAKPQQDESWKAWNQNGDSGTHPLDSIQHGIHDFWGQVNPVAGVQGLAGAIRNPVQTGKAMGQQNADLWQRTKDAYNSGDYLGAVRHGVNYALNGVPGLSLGSSIDEAQDKIGDGDIAGGVGQSLGIGTNLAIAAKAPKILSKAADIPGSVRAGVQRVSDMKNGLVADPKLTLTQAIKPRSTALGFSKSLDSALPDLKATEVGGKPISSVGDLLDAVKSAKKANRQQWTQYTGPASQMGTQVDLSPVADSIAGSASETMKLENPAQYEALIEASKKYRGQFPIEQVEKFLRDTNAELDAYYAKYPTAQRSSLRANPETAATAAKADALRDSLYRALDDPNLGEGPRAINRRYGALLDVEEEAQRRQNVAMRQQPESLQQQLSKAHAAGRAALGAGKILAGNPSGALDIASSLAQRKVSDWLKEQQTTDALIARAFKSYKGSAPEIPPPVKPVIRGLLEAPKNAPVDQSIGSRHGDIIGQPQRNLQMPRMDLLDEANLRGEGPPMPPPGLEGAPQPPMNRAARRVGVQPQSTGIPEGVERGVDMRNTFSRQLTGKPYQELSNPDRLAIDDLIARQSQGDPLGIKRHLP